MGRRVRDVVLLPLRRSCARSAVGPPAERGSLPRLRATAPQHTCDGLRVFFCFKGVRQAITGVWNAAVAGWKRSGPQRADHCFGVLVIDLAGPKAPAWRTVSL